MPSQCVDPTRFQGSTHDGFTLMEVLVAVVIVALAVTVFFQLLSGSMNLERRGRDRIQDLMLADRVFGELLRLDIREADFPWSGETQGMSWQMRIFPVEIVEWHTEQGEPPLRLPRELFCYEFRYARPDRPEQTLSRHALHPPDFFNDQFRSRAFSAIPR